MSIPDEPELSYSSKVRNRILLVDDDPDLTSLLEISLRVAGYDIAKTERGEDVPEIIATFDPQVIVLDIMMPGMSGFDVLRELRARYLNPPEVVILSALAEADDIVQGKELGAFTYLFKPVTRSRLIEAIEAALAARAKRQPPLP